MSNEKRLEKEIDFLREEYKNYFLIFFALMSGEAGLLYAVVSGEKPVYVLFLAIFGFVASIFILSKINNTKNIIYKKLDELEKE